jgi:uncharacterized repeat protein (TIGR02543 family)
VGSSGTIVTSPDGLTWTSQTSGTTSYLYGVAYGNNTFVAVGDSGTIVTSPDGVTWMSPMSDTMDTLNGMVFGNNTFVAVGYGTILTSPDGLTWTSQTSGTTNNLNGVAYVNNTFVAVGDSGTILTSPDGVTWTSQTSGTTAILRDVTYAKNTFMAVGDSGTIVTSPDGVTWTSSMSGTANRLYGVAYGNNTFVAVGSSGTIVTSPDGVTWTSQTSGTTGYLYGVAYGNNTFVAVEEFGTIVTSPDGVTWASQTSGTANMWYDVAYGNNTFVAVSEGALGFSSDGITWEYRIPGLPSVYGVAYGNDSFVAFGDSLMQYEFLKITYDGNGSDGGNVPVDSNAYNAGETASVSGNTGGLTKTGYVFSGWTTVSGAVYQPDDAFTIQADTTLYAQWLSSNAMLGGLSVSQGTLDFNPSTLNYSVNVPNSVESLDVFITKGDLNQSITVTGAVYQTVTDSVYHYEASNLVVGANPIQIQISAQDGTSSNTYTIDVTRAAAPSSGGSSGGGGGGSAPSEPTEPTDPNNTDQTVTINGETQQAIATATTSEQDGQTVLTVAVEAAKLTKQLEQAGNKPVVTIPVTTAADKVTAALTGDAVKAMENKSAILEVQTLNGSYKLPASEVFIDQLSERLGAGTKLESITLHIDIAKSDNAKAELLANAAGKGGFSVVVTPVDFTVTAAFGDKKVQVTKFNSFVEREIPLPEGTDASRITTAVVLNEDGTTRSVPTKIVTRGGVTYAVINSLTNSTYSVVWNPVEFKDVEQHWSKDAVNDMGSRMIISGVGNGMFNPDQDITRAEFAAIIVRGLGLKLDTGASVFSDVKASAWYNSAVNTANAYQLINGFEDGTFRPNDKITREQAMVIISKAMEITKLSDQFSNPSMEGTLRPYEDVTAISAWALQGVANTVEVGIVSGRSSTELAPKDNMTRAEVAAIIERLLRKSDLI